MNAEQAEIEALAENLLSATDCPVVHCRLMADVLRLPEHNHRLKDARRRLESSRQVQALLEEQHADGSWGRFHSQDTRLNQKIHTTEKGVERAVALGLGGWHPRIKRTRDYLAALLSGAVKFPDPPERNVGWATGVQLFSASTLARLDPQHPRIKPVRGLWREITMRTFCSGIYDASAEIQAHTELAGTPVKDSYLVISNKYALNLLGSQTGTLPAKIEEALLAWLWYQPEGIGYLSVPLSAPPGTLSAGDFDRWFASLELFSASFSTWVKFAPVSMAWLWDQRAVDGFWDLGARFARSDVLPFSDHWRAPRNRVIDWSTRTLCLFARYYQAHMQCRSTEHTQNNLE